jgi:cobyrinic acid a,c-diamide synthase
VPIQKWLICPISALHEKFNPRNINHMPAVKFYARLDLEQIIEDTNGCPSISGWTLFKGRRNNMGAPITKGLVIAGTHSGAGKTTLTLGLMAALRKRGLAVAPFKIGPDFIDPGHHAHMVGRASRNLDGWMLSRAYNQHTFRDHAAGCDVAVVEGVMGLFDGFSGNSEEGSTAQMAKWLDLPVLLVVDAASMARSAAALVQGFQRFDPQVRFAGVVFNRLGSEGHRNFLQEAMAAYVDLPFLGGLLRDNQLCIPERHLGLTTAEDGPLTADQEHLLATSIEAGLDVDGLLARLPEVPAPSGSQPARRQKHPEPVRMGVARDKAFCFYYPDNLELLVAAGVEPVPFSPMNDARLPEDLDGLYFGGGYPELHADRLSGNLELRAMIRHCSRQGMPIYGECGGFMYLCRELEDTEGTIHPMCGCFPFRSRMHSGLRALGYREVRLTADTLLGEKGHVLRGHEFHYSDLSDASSAGPVEAVYTVGRRAGGYQSTEGYLVGRTLGSYIHLHLGSRPESARALADACRQYRQTKKNGGLV